MYKKSHKIIYVKKNVHCVLKNVQHVLNNKLCLYQECILCAEVSRDVLKKSSSSQQEKEKVTENLQINKVKERKKI